MAAYKDTERGTWYCKFYYTDWNGERKQKKKRGFKKQKDALEWEREFLTKSQNSCDMLFSSLVELYFEDIKTRIRPNTLENKKSIVSNRVLPYFEKLPINEIKPNHIRKWQNELISNGYTPTYLKTVNTQLNAILNFAVKFYDLPSNPSHKTGSIGKTNADTMSFWTLDEFNRFLKALVDPTHKVMFMILFYTGIRIGELLGLFWEDIDIENKTISINRSMQRIKGGQIFNPPKTPKSKRTIPIPDFLVTEINNYKEKTFEPTGRIFNLSKDTVFYTLNTTCKRIGIKKIRVHDIRHSHASLLIELGFNPLIISERLGHEKVQTTLDIYSHLYPNKHEEVAQRLNNLVPK